MDSYRINLTLKLNWANILTVVFIILKLCHVISWSWLWVLSPTWILLLLTTIIFVIFKTLWGRG